METHNVVQRAEEFYWQLAPHAKKRESAKVIHDLLSEIERLQKALAEAKDYEHFL